MTWRYITSIHPLFICIHGLLVSFIINDEINDDHWGVLSLSPPVEVKERLDRLFNEILLRIAHDTIFLPLIDYEPLEPVHFLENRLTAQQRRNLETGCEGYFLNITLRSWIEGAGQHIRKLLIAFLLLSGEDIGTTRLMSMPWEKMFSPTLLKAMKMAAEREFPQHLIQVFDFWRLKAPLDNPMRQKTKRIIAPTAPCPCLSEQVYQNCCGAKKLQLVSSQ